jgi:hypothetical protein
MNNQISLYFTRSFIAEKEKLWMGINTFSKLNNELHPILKMTCPRIYKNKPFENYPMNKYAFTSIIFFFEIIPIEIYSARLIEVIVNKGFIEKSKSLFTSVWKHKRTIKENNGLCVIEDELNISAKNKLLAPIFKVLLKRVFAKRYDNIEKYLSKVNST